MEDCPVCHHAQQVLALSKELSQAMRQLRRSLRKCEGCPHMETCPLWRSFNALVDQAILEVNQEWGLAG
jgi:hypothetical protein